MPANPVSKDYFSTFKNGYDNTNGFSESTGLTKREHFVGLAMQGLLAGAMGDSALWETPQEWVRQITESSLEFADAQLKELDK